jgi:aerobic-type carbon monoxide dehydrogenase small subunit (CoxS/CutS family)
MKKTCEIAATVNGTVYEAAVEPRMLLADFLRHTLGLGRSPFAEMTFADWPIFLLILTSQD